ncbi:MAG: hexose kinase [Defluviitaleaceae bacterium]|nr:hexose kinase [Defluviitaleaceae bacterium]
MANNNNPISITVMSLNPSIDWQWTTPSFVYGGLNRAKSGEHYASGKGINVCAALKNIGLDPLCMGFNFRDNGDFITNALDKWGVRHDFVMVDGEVRVNIKLYDSLTGEMTELNQPGAHVPECAVHALHNKVAAVTFALDNIHGSNQMLVLSGSMPAGVPTDTYKQLCATWPGMVILDADGDALQIALTGKKPPYCIKPNLYELKNLAANHMLPDAQLLSKEDIAVFCQHIIHKYGVNMICVSMGAGGAMLVTEAKNYYVPAQEVTVRGVQGAGDAMVAGLVYGLTHGLTAQELLQTATAAATATVARDGTQMCTHEGFMKYMCQFNLGNA